MWRKEILRPENVQLMTPLGVSMAYGMRDELVRKYDPSYLENFGIIKFKRRWCLQEIDNFPQHFENMTGSRFAVHAVGEDLNQTDRERSWQQYGVLGSREKGMPTYFQALGANVSSRSMEKGKKTYYYLDVNLLSRKRHVFVDPEMFFRVDVDGEFWDEPFSGEQPGDSYFVMRGIPKESIVAISDKRVRSDSEVERLIR